MEWSLAWKPPAKHANGAVFRLRAYTNGLLARLPGIAPSGCIRLTADGFSFPLRLRGSGGIAPLFLASIRYDLLRTCTTTIMGCQRISVWIYIIWYVLFDMYTICRKGGVTESRRKAAREIRPSPGPDPGQEKRWDDAFNIPLPREPLRSDAV